MKESAAERLVEDQAKEKQVPLLLKAETEGALAALRFAVDKLKKEFGEQRELTVVKAGLGHVTESDVELAEAFGARILGFNVRASGALAKQAKAKKVRLESHPVIYNLLDDLKADLQGKLGKLERVVTGQASVLATFQMNGKKRSDPVWHVAGCKMLDGEISKGDRLSVVRSGVVVCESTGAGSLRVLKQDVDKVERGECGIALTSFDEFRVGDVIQAFKMVK